MTFEPSEQLKALASAAAAPEALREPARRSRFGSIDQVSVVPGQVWRARREDLVVFLLILGPVVVDERVELAVHAAPMSVDPPGEDDQSLVLGPARTAFGVDVTVWAGLACLAPIRVLDDVLDEVGPEVVDVCLAVTRGVGDVVLPSDVRRGRLLESVFDPAVEVRSQVEDDLSALVSAPGLPLAAEAGTTQVERLPLTIPQVKEALDIAQPAAMQLIRGKYPLNVAQAKRLAEVAGVSSEVVLRTIRPLPVDVVEAVEHPRARRRLRLVAEVTGTSEADMRLQAAYAVYAMPARETGGSGDWQGRLDRWLDAKLSQTFKSPDEVD